MIMTDDWLMDDDFRYTPLTATLIKELVRSSGLRPKRPTTNRNGATIEKYYYEY